MNKLVPKSKNISCPHCRAETVEDVMYSDTVDFRNMELDVENLQKSICRNCGHKWTTSEQRVHNSSIMRDAYAVVRDNLRGKHGLLTGQEISQMREFFALGQREAAALFGGGYNAFNKYESGEVLQSFAMDRLLRLTFAVGNPAISFLRDVFSQPNFLVISTSSLKEMRITISGGESPFNKANIRGTSETQQFEHIPILEYPNSQEPLFTTHKNYLAITR
ncbi:MAG: type II TA system antitoxin MqsA family protein [Candidatus Nitrotoga sp.]